MRSSYYGKVESSCSGPANWPDERTGDFGVKHQDRDRLKVLHEVKGEHLTQRAAAEEQLGISGRWVRALLGRAKQEGDRG